MALLSTEAEGVNESMPEDSRAKHVNRANRVGALLGLLDDHRAEGASGDQDIPHTPPQRHEQHE